MPGELVKGFALVAIVLTVAGLTSGIVERAPISFPMVFLGLGFLLGDRGFGVLQIGPDDALLETVATVTLATVLCLEAVRIGNIGMSGAGFGPILSLGPGTLIIDSVIAAASYFLLNVPVVIALLLGTILASTAPMVLRDVVREERIPASVRQALNIEAGTNDIVVLPTLLILITLANAEASSAAGWAVLVVQVLFLGPLVGFAIGAGATWLTSRVDRRYGINEVYQSLYGVGIVLLAYAAATAMGGDGFLVAFAAGFAVAVLNFNLCQCFLDYGETASEMAMPLSFILFGVVISDIFVEAPLIPTLVLALIMILVARPQAIGLVLRKATVSNRPRVLIGWFGPRGLNLLLLALLVVHAGVAGAEFVLAAVGVVVTVSVVAHGASATAPRPRRLGHAAVQAYGRAVERDAPEEEREDVGGIFEGDASASIRTDPEQLARMLEGDEPPLVPDVRTRSQHEQGKTRIPGALRVAPDRVRGWSRDREEAHGSQVHGQRIVAYCT